MDIHNGLHRCNICDKKYASYKSLWNHNKNFHIESVNDIVKVVKDTVKEVKDNVKIKSYICENCNKCFSCRQSKYEHKKNVCKNKINHNIKESNAKIIKNKIINNKNSHNTTNNGTINNIVINKFGNESLYNLSSKDIKKLIKNNNYLVDIIKLLNFNEKFPENHSFCNTSLEGKYISVLNTDTNKIEKINICTQ